MDNNFFNNRLRELRKERNLTQAQVANALGIKLSTYSHMENDGKRPSPDILQRIARLFLVSVDNLTGESENKPKQGLPYVIHETPPLVFHQSVIIITYASLCPAVLHAVRLKQIRKCFPLLLAFLDKFHQ